MGILKPGASFTAKRNQLTALTFVSKHAPGTGDTCKLDNFLKAAKIDGFKSTAVIFKDVIQVSQINRKMRHYHTGKLIKIKFQPIFASTFLSEKPNKPSRCQMPEHCAMSKILKHHSSSKSCLSLYIESSLMNFVIFCRCQLK